MFMHSLVSQSHRSNSIAVCVARIFVLFCGRGQSIMPFVFKGNINFHIVKRIDIKNSIKWRYEGESAFNSSRTLLKNDKAIV